jgi:starch-binding outer membrane protein, SusD/RagB family
MKNTIIYKISFVALLFIATNCADNLSIEPANSIDESNALKTSADVEALLVGAYDALGSGNLYGGNILRDAELLADAGEIIWDGTFVAPGEIWGKSMLVTNDQAQSTWLDAYRAINICNNVLAKLSVVVAAKQNKVEGEAKFVRGALYFELARTYARTYIDGNPSSNPGVPLVLTPTTGENATGKVVRNTVAEIYAQVIKDLIDAESKLPSSNGFFATSDAASAILSRVYLMQGQYTKAAEAADKVISSGNYSLLSTYASNFNKTSAGAGSTTSNEDVFSIQVTNQDGTNNMNTFFASSDFGGRGDIYINQAHFDLYEAGDERLSLFYDDERTGKWNNVYGNVNIVRLAEMYLTRAEANLREDSSIGTDPLDDINLIRNRVGLSSLTSVTLDQILTERHLELAFEGHWIHDVKRTQGTVGLLSFNSPKLVFPIPKREILLNNSLVQNEGYGN